MATDCLPYILAENAPAHFDQTTWITIALAVIAFMYVLMRSRAKKNKDPLERPQLVSSLAQQRTVEREMSNLLVELSEMSRTISASLDTRAAKLQALLDVADRKILELQSANSAAPQITSTEPHAESIAPASSASALPESLPPQDEAAGPDHAQIYALADEKHTVNQIAAAVDRTPGEIEFILALRPHVTHAS